MIDPLSKAILIALRAHDTQRDKSEEPYILHPLRLMAKMETEEEKVVAVLHDTIEDSRSRGVVLREIAKVFPHSVIEAINILTRRPKEPYLNYIEMIGKYELARKVKIADLEDNLNTLRLIKLESDDLRRIEKYHKSLRYLLSIEKH